MEAITIMAISGVCLGALCLEAILLIVLETPWAKSKIWKAKRAIRHFMWKAFDWKNDFEEGENGQ